MTMPEKITLYELYDCDIWRTYASINVQNRILLTTHRKEVAKAIYNRIQEEPNYTETLKEISDPEILIEMVENQNVDYLHLVQTEL